jgi:beta-galactosidase GanA
MKKHDSREIFGAEIQYFRLDPQYWDAIVGKLKDCGLRCVTTYVQWETHLVGEPDKRPRRASSTSRARPIRA